MVNFISNIQTLTNAFQFINKQLTVFSTGPQNFFIVEDGGEKGNIGSF